MVLLEVFFFKLVFTRTRIQFLMNFVNFPLSFSLYQLFILPSSFFKLQKI